MAVIRGRRVRHARMGRLVQPPQATGAHRKHPASRGRRPLLRYARTASHGSVTQTKQPPGNPGRFMALPWIFLITALTFATEPIWRIPLLGFNPTLDELLQIRWFTHPG